MRYTALWVYASVLEVAGGFMVLASVVIGIAIGVVARDSGSPWVGNMGLLMGAFVGLLGSLLGLAIAACGQLCNVLRDTEHNTRLALGSEYRVVPDEW